MINFVVTVCAHYQLKQFLFIFWALEQLSIAHTVTPLPQMLSTVSVPYLIQDKTYHPMKKELNSNVKK